MKSIAVLHQSFTFGLNGEPSRSMWTMTIYNDQPIDRFATNRKRRVASLLDESLPELLRTTAAYLEQEGIDDLELLGTKVREETKR